jgi:hypothetical protein
MLDVAGSAIRIGLQQWRPKTMLALPNLYGQLSRAQRRMSTKAGPAPIGVRFQISLPEAEARFQRFCEVKGVSALCISRSTYCIMTESPLATCPSGQQMYRLKSQKARQYSAECTTATATCALYMQHTSTIDYCCKTSLCHCEELSYSTVAGCMHRRPSGRLVVL